MYTIKMHLNEVTQVLGVERVECLECNETFLINKNRKFKGAEYKCPHCGTMLINQINKGVRLEKV